MLKTRDPRAYRARKAAEAAQKLREDKQAQAAIVRAAKTAAIEYNSDIVKCYEEHLPPQIALGHKMIAQCTPVQ